MKLKLTIVILKYIIYNILKFSFSWEYVKVNKSINCKNQVIYCLGNIFKKGENNERKIGYFLFNVNYRFPFNGSGQCWRKHIFDASAIFRC